MELIGNNLLLLLILVIFNKEIRAESFGERFPEKRKCLGKITFRTTAIPSWEASSYANSSGSSPSDCAENCFTRLEFCKTTKYDSVHGVCLYSYTWRECAVENNDVTGSEHSGQQNDVIYCVKCVGEIHQKQEEEATTSSTQAASTFQTDLQRLQPVFHLLPSNNSGSDLLERLKNAQNPVGIPTTATVPGPVEISTSTLSPVGNGDGLVLITTNSLVPQRNLPWRFFTSSTDSPFPTSPSSVITTDNRLITSTTSDNRLVTTSFVENHENRFHGTIPPAENRRHRISTTTENHPVSIPNQENRPGTTQNLEGHVTTTETGVVITSIATQEPFRLVSTTTGNPVVTTSGNPFTTVSIQSGNVGVPITAGSASGSGQSFSSRDNTPWPLINSFNEDEIDFGPPAAPFPLDRSVPVGENGQRVVRPGAISRVRGPMTVGAPLPAFARSPSGFFRRVTNESFPQLQAGLAQKVTDESISASVQTESPIVINETGLGLTQSLANGSSITGAPLINGTNPALAVSQIQLGQSQRLISDFSQLISGVPVTNDSSLGVPQVQTQAVTSPVLPGAVGVTTLTAPEGAGVNNSTGSAAGLSGAGAGAGLPVAGTGLPGAGVALPGAGSGFPGAGAGLSGAGSAVFGAGTGLTGAAAVLPGAGIGAGLSGAEIALPGPAAGLPAVGAGPSGAGADASGSTVPAVTSPVVSTTASQIPGVPVAVNQVPSVPGFSSQPLDGAAPTNQASAVALPVAQISASVSQLPEVQNSALSASIPATRHGFPPSISPETFGHSSPTPVLQAQNQNLPPAQTSVQNPQVPQNQILQASQAQQAPQTQLQQGVQAQTPNFPLIEQIVLSPIPPLNQSQARPEPANQPPLAPESLNQSTAPSLTPGVQPQDPVTNQTPTGPLESVPVSSAAPQDSSPRFSLKTTPKLRRTSIVNNILRTLDHTSDMRHMPFLANVSVDTKSNVQAVQKITLIEIEPAKLLNYENSTLNGSDSLKNESKKDEKPEEIINLEKTDEKAETPRNGSHMRRNADPIRLYAPTVNFGFGLNDPRFGPEEGEVSGKKGKDQGAESWNRGVTVSNCPSNETLPCSLGFGRDCRMRRNSQGCRICICPPKSPANGCAGPNPATTASGDRMEMLMGKKTCPNGRPAQRVIRFYRKKTDHIDDCVPIQDTYCGWQLNIGPWRMPRTKEECYFYCFSDSEWENL